MIAARSARPNAVAVLIADPEVDGQPHLTVISDEVADGDFAARIELHNDGHWESANSFSQTMAFVVEDR